MTTTARLTTSGPYRRNPAHDRRVAHGDDFAGDCWEEPSAVRSRVAVGGMTGTALATPSRIYGTDIKRTVQSDIQRA